MEERICVVCGRDADGGWEMVSGWLQNGSDLRSLNMRESHYRYACDHCVKNRPDDVRQARRF